MYSNTIQKGANINKGIGTLGTAQAKPKSPNDIYGFA